MSLVDIATVEADVMGEKTTRFAAVYLNPSLSLADVSLPSGEVLNVGFFVSLLCLFLKR